MEFVALIVFAKWVFAYLLLHLKDAAADWCTAVMRVSFLQGCCRNVCDTGRWLLFRSVI